MEEDEFQTITSEIRKKVIKTGGLGRRPSLKWTCVVDLDFPSHVPNEKLKNSTKIVKIGEGIGPFERSVERCLESMHLNEQSLFLIKSNRDCDALSVMITLKSCEEKPYIFQWTDDEKLKASNHFKSMGTDLFNKNQIEEAFYKFSSALKLLITMDSILEADYPDPEIANLRVALLNNLARCHLHYKNYLSAIELCTKSIDICCSSKALYRRALAQIELKEYEKAENDLVQLLKLEPNNKAALVKYKLVRELDRTNRENYHSVLKKMFR